MARSTTRAIALSGLGAGILIAVALTVYLQVGTQAGWLQSPFDDGGSWIPTVVWALGIALTVVAAIALLVARPAPRGSSSPLADAP